MKSSSRRSVIVAAALLAWAALIIARLVQLQVYQYAFWTRRARRQQERTVEVSPVRGVIYDRNHLPLAMSVQVDSIFAVPDEIHDPAATAQILSPILHISATELKRKLREGHFFSWIKRKVSDREAARVRQLNLQGIYMQKESKRFYPKRELAAHVLGYVGMDDHGLAGIELRYDRAIRGRPGKLLIQTDARQHWLSRAGRPPVPGKNIVLTLDENIQYITEKELAVAVAKFHPVSASVIVQDPQTGEILALANQPTFNPNTYQKFPPNALRDRAVSSSYEPGSTFKIVTVSAALEEKLARPDEQIDCQMGSIVLAGHVIHDHKPYGLLTVNQIIQDSSDVGAIKLALRLGDDSMYRYIRRFGFGSRTGIELPGEARGLTKPPARWSKISIGAIAMGQEIGVTPLQMVTAASVVANGGWWVRPHIVRGDFREDSASQPERRRVISEQTAAALRKMMRLVVTNGTAKSAQLDGYTSAGKTGTAQKVDPRTGAYSHRNYVASFVGFVPAEDPLFTILVVVDSPRGKIYGGEVAAPVFKRIAEQILAYRNVPPSLPIKPSPVETAWKPPVETAAPVPHAEESGEQNPTTMLSLDSGMTVPSLLGKTVRAVVEQAQSGGLEVRMVGSGIAYRQSPSPGSVLPDGGKITVWFQVGGAAEETQETPQPGKQSARRRPGNIPPQQTAPPAVRQSGENPQTAAPAGTARPATVRPQPGTNVIATTG